MRFSVRIRIRNSRSSHPARPLLRRRRALPAFLVLPLLLSSTPAAWSAERPDRLQQEIDRAVQRGREYLLKQFSDLASRPPNNHPMGRVALPLAALLRAGISTRHPFVTTALERLDRMKPAETYDVACYLFALDALWQRKIRESARGQSGVTILSQPRTAQGKVLEKMKELVDWLVQARVPGQGVWSYRPSRGGHDYSNSQFAILGLQVGIENRIRIPKEVFIEIANQFMRTQKEDGPEMEIRITYNPPIEKAFTKTYVARQERSRDKPAGWSYRGDRAKPYPSMSAAGASSLLIARDALKKLRALPSSLSGKLERSITRSLGWIQKQFDGYMKGNRHYYYTLYSLEKVGDLGDIVLFGGRDWYRSGAEELIRRQSKNGGWGDSVNTSFALLFLTRATRPHLRSMDAPTIYTVTENEKRDSQMGDLVYVDDLEAFISAREFFRFLGNTRRSALISIAEQVVSNYALDRQEELIPYLLGIWVRSDSITTFAKRALAGITGVRGKTQEFYAQWHAHYLEVVAYIEGESRDLDELARLLSGAPGVRLRQRILDLIERESLVGASSALASELGVPDAAYRQRVHAILCRFTGQRFPLRDGRTQGNREADVALWRDWWRDNNGPLMEKREIRRWVETLNGPHGSKEVSPAERKRLLEALVEKGRKSVPFLLGAMERSPYRIEVVLALERISGEQLGFLPDPWRAWWRQMGG